MAYVNADTIHGHHLSGSNKMVPLVPPNKFPSAEAPAEATSGSWELKGRPSSVQIVNDRGSDIFFKFENGGSFINFGSHKANSGSLQISPLAWSGSAAANAVGDVIFIYSGKH